MDLDVTAGHSGRHENVSNKTINENNSSLLAYLLTIQHRVSIGKLYDSPAVCLTIFRQLPELARHFALRLLLITSPVPQRVVKAWADKHAQQAIHRSLGMLEELGILLSTELVGSLEAWHLERNFQQQLRTTLLGGGRPWFVQDQVEADKHPKSAVQLDDYARERWDSILHFMTGANETSTTSSNNVGSKVREILHIGNLMSKDGGITRVGFQFLLLDRAAQVWQFLQHYLDQLTDGASLSDAIHFFCQLGSAQLGTSYPVNQLTTNQQAILQHLREFGLVFRRKSSSNRYYPTSLALSLPAGFGGQFFPDTLTSSSLSTANSQQGWIMLETNYRLFGYTDSPFRTSLLSIFCELLYRFPNLVVAQITRESVRQALQSGITVHQLLTFLRRNVHPQMLIRRPVLPPTLCDQLLLWEQERSRLKFAEGCLYEGFLNIKDFEVVRVHASDIGALLWENTEKRLLVVSNEGHDDVKRFWKRHKQNND